MAVAVKMVQLAGDSFWQRSLMDPHIGLGTVAFQANIALSPIRHPQVKVYIFMASLLTFGYLRLQP